MAVADQDTDPLDTDMPSSTDRSGNSGKREPSPYTDPHQQSSALSPREKETVTGLRRLDPQLAGLYEIGRKLVNDIEQPGNAHVVAYVGRELSRGVIGCRLRDEEIEETGQISKKPGCAAEGEGNRPRIAAALQLPEDDQRVTEWARMPPRFAKWEKYRDGGPPPDDVQEAFEQFSQMLFGLAAGYFATEAELNALLEVDVPAAEHARRLRDLQLRPAQRRYFFRRLEDHRWVSYLSSEGFFANPPGAKVRDDGAPSPRPWSEGHYLVRIAPKAPVPVTEVLVALPKTNDNPDVWNSVAKAASQLPADLAVRVVPAVTSALKSVPGLIRWSDSVVGFVEHLAALGSSEVFHLAHHLLFIAGAKAVDPHDTAHRDTTYWVFPRIVEPDRQRLVDRTVAALESTNPERTLCLLLAKINRVQALADTLRTESSSFSNVEMDLRESRARDNDHGPETNTIRLLCQSAVGVARRLAAQGREEAASVIELVEKREGRFFASLGYHVLAAAGHFLTSRLDRFLKSEEARYPEYPAGEVAEVLRVQFRNASAPARKAYANAVAEGLARDRQRRILTFFRGDIPQEFQHLASELDLAGVTPSWRRQKMAEQGWYIEPGSGFVGRREIQNLAGWPAKKVAEFLRNGGAVDYYDLEKYAKDQPADGIGLLAGCAASAVAPSAVDGVLVGLAKAVKSGAQLDWSLVLRYLRQIIRQIAALEAPSAAVLTEWRSAVDYSARLIRQGCAEDAIAAEYAREVWGALEEAATLDTVWSEPSRDQIRDLRGVLLAVLNDAAGTIANAAIAAGLWQYRSCLQSGEVASEEEKAAARAIVRRSLVPILNGLLNVAGPNHPIPRAVIGAHLPRLYLLVPEWLEERTDRLFQGGLEDPVANPVWTAYIIWNGPCDAVFQALRPWYAEAASNAAMWKAKLGTVAPLLREASEAFAKHLVTAFLQGWIRRGDDDRLLETAYENLSPSDWAYAYFRIFGDSRDGDGPIPAAIVERLIVLWEWRVSELTGSSEATVEEAKGLGRFLDTPHIPADVLMRLGPRTARLAEGQFRLDWGRLLELAHSDPEGVFEIADAFLDGNLKAPDGYVPVDEVKPVLGLVLTTAAAEVRERVRGLIDRLGERGYRDFKDLVDDERQ